MSTFKIIIRTVKTKDGKKTFKSYKLVDEENNGKLVDCVMCKTISVEQKAVLDSMHKAEVSGDISINFNYEYPKAFVRTITDIVKIK